MTKEGFQPNWVSAPGETISEILEERGLSLSELAAQLSFSSAKIRDLMQGRLPITLEDARKLRNALGASTEFWMMRDYQYREDVARINNVDQAWLNSLPLVDMVKFGWLSPPPLPEEEFRSCLEFFDVSSISEWNQKYSDIEKVVSMRTTSTFESNPASVAAWLRQGEIEAGRLRSGEWNSERFREALINLRKLTRIKDPQKFLPAMQHECSPSGVSVVALRAPNGCRASGATVFLEENRALILMSFRHLTDDHFWFSFFHEAGHLLLHSHSTPFLEGIEQVYSVHEQEANVFAAQILILPEFHEDLMSLSPNYREIIRFSVRIGISPGIVVGQLQHYGKLRHNQLNRLKRRYKWIDSS